MTDSIVNRHALYVKADYRPSLVRYCREALERTKQISSGPVAARRTELMGRFLAYVETLPPDSHYFRALSRIQQTVAGHPDRGWHPTDGQAKLLTLLGSNIAADDPEPAEVLGELISLGINDLAASLNSSARRILEQRAAEVEASVRGALEARVANAERSAAEAEAHRARAVAERDQVRAERDHYATLADEIRAGTPAEQPDAELPSGPFQRRKTDTPGLCLSRRKSGILLYEVKAGRNRPWKSFDERSEALEYLEEARAEKTGA